jgi:hypothetical protein
MDVPADGGSERVVALADPDEAGLAAGAFEQALVVPEANAVLENRSRTSPSRG